MLLFTLESIRMKESLLSNKSGDKALSYERNSFYNQPRLITFKKESEINRSKISNSILSAPEKKSSWGIFAFCTPCSTD